MEQFKTLEDLREYIAKIGKYYARPTSRGEHPTLYVGRNNKDIIMGVRRIDFLLSPCGNWVLPTEEMGLSFSTHWSHLRGVYNMKAKRNGGKPIDVYWVLEKADIPSGLAFVLDKEDKKGRHYFLCATEKMHISQLVKKLQWLADRMTAVRDAGKVL